MSLWLSKRLQKSIWWNIQTRFIRYTISCSCWFLSSLGSERPQYKLHNILPWKWYDFFSKIYFSFNLPLSVSNITFFAYTYLVASSLIMSLPLSLFFLSRSLSFCFCSAISVSVYVSASVSVYYAYLAHPIPQLTTPTKLYPSAADLRDTRGPPLSP